MMKRIMACLLAIVCLFTAVAFAEGASMKVIKCKEAVNIRRGPSTDTESLGLVPLGTVVTDCVQVEGSEWYSVNFNGMTGYIRGDFLELVEGSPVAEPQAEGEALQPAAGTQAEGEALQPAAGTQAEGEALQPATQAEGEALQPAAETQAEGTPLAPADGGEQAEEIPTDLLEEPVDNAPVASITEATEYDDDFVILDTTVNGVRVIGRQIYQESNEYLMAVGLDANGTELWKKETTTDAITELMQTDVFIGGTANVPLVMMYNACKGLSAIDPTTGEVVWELAKEEVDLGGSIVYAVDANGVIYIGGYYGPDPVAIDANGNVLWQATSGGEDATWMYRMDLQDNGIACAYGSMAGENYGTIIYGFDGAVLDVIYDA